MSREVAVHFCPVDRNAPRQTCSAAWPRSASASTTEAFLPPISVCTGLPSSPQRAMTARPTSVDPVNDTASTPGWPTMAEPASASPYTRLSTPSGRPASTSAFARR